MAIKERSYYYMIGGRKIHLHGLVYSCSQRQLFENGLIASLCKHASRRSIFHPSQSSYADVYRSVVLSKSIKVLIGGTVDITLDQA